LKDEVIPYKKYIKRVVELSTVWEINRWNDWYGKCLINDLLGEVGQEPIRRNSKWLGRCLWILGLVAVYYWSSTFIDYWAFLNSSLDKF
jgi:hypothetical protein